MRKFLDPMVDEIPMPDRPPRPRQTDLAWSVEDDTASDAQSSHRGLPPKSVATEITRLLRERRIKIPMLPQAATEALRLASDPKASFKSIERTVSSDPMLAARVLAVANSPLYGGKDVKSLSLALQRLGTGTIRDILYQAVAEAHIFRGADGETLRSEREHAVAVGVAARLVCRRVGLDSGYAFVCGLLHDIGRPVLLDMLRGSRKGLSDDEIRSAVDGLHPQFGAYLATEWALPKLVVEACRRHHHYAESEKRQYSQIGNAIAVADRLAIAQGLGRPAQPVALESDRTYYDLGLSPADVESTVEELRQLQNAQDE